MANGEEKLCSRCGTRPATIYLCDGRESRNLCRACYEAVVPPEVLAQERIEDERLQDMLRRGKCCFCGGSTVGGSVFPGGTAAVIDPDSYLWCTTCMKYFEEFKARPEGQIQEQIPENPDDEAAWEAANERVRSYFRRLEAFVRQKVSGQ